MIQTCHDLYDIQGIQGRNKHEYNLLESSNRMYIISIVNATFSSFCSVLISDKVL